LVEPECFVIQLAVLVEQLVALVCSLLVEQVVLQLPILEKLGLQLFLLEFQPPYLDY